MGFGPFCASCVHLQRAHAQGRGDCGKQSTCGGPLSGRAFPKYKGPMLVSSAICFACGGTPSFSVEVDGDFLGCCEKHRSLLEKKNTAGAP